MSNNILTKDTICALATAAGGAIGVIRVSGDNAVSIVDKVFRSPGEKPLTEAKGGTVHYGTVVDASGNTVDEVLATVFLAPHSYTGENSVEISCHGSRYILKTVIQLLIDCGCRQAEPGEYTRRAYMNGKMDLSQAEAVADLIASTNQATHKMAMSQLRGHFSSELASLREHLLKLTSLLELELDFSDHEELEFADRTELQDLASHTDRRITTLARSFDTGNALKQGIPVAIVGKTNVGKSTLLNRLLHEEKAIVSDIHGTTRDVIEDTVQTDGITFRFIDTAGIRKTADIVESLGIERTYQKMDEAAIVLWVVDRQPSPEETQDIKQRTKGKKLIVVRNKADLCNEEFRMKNRRSAIANEESKAGDRPLGVENEEPIINISAKHGTGIDTLQDALVRAADIPALTENDVIVTSARHYEALQHAHANLSRVLDGLTNGQSSDLIAEDLRAALAHLADITGGQITPQETLNNIFQHFCVGK